MSISIDTAAAGADLDAASPDTYCLWTPGLSSSAASSPSRPPRKSGSTGSTSRWRRIGDLVVGRSHSDGREKFVFLSAPSSPARDHGSSSPVNKAKKQQQTRGGMSMSYGGASVNKGGARRTFLPYRQDLVGLFANVQGLRRSHHHPF
ncbi:hypothetical protein PR202_ga10373 [Eleusine coracana subsp. coracana]|uniref:Uncharacterized protein n=1 Tax=Eleusine coracana subsp. coracana TaxID=191504 RepID=A0AAV5C6L1_ELECO|nr:hypothetical protein PR202_ga10373 [Eleusine coracana subsp. coracana]